MVEKTDLSAKEQPGGILARFDRLWSTTTATEQDIHVEAARRDHITRAALTLMTILVLPFTLLILTMWGIGFIDGLGVAIMLGVDAFIFAG